MKTPLASGRPTVQFEVGKKYNRKADIHDPFGGSRQSGISPSRVSDAVFIFTGESGAAFGYRDDALSDENGEVSFLYTGEGQTGDMTFTKGNKAIVEHSREGRALHLFKSLGKGLDQEYLGEFVYAKHRFEPGLDREKKMRRMIVFQLVSVRAAAFLEFDEIAPGNLYIPRTLAEARSLAIAAATAVGERPGQSAVRALYARSKAVKDYVLMRADGICECCSRPAPFTRLNGSPYLEPHHTTRVSDGGPDHPMFVGAICPTCHREIHYGAEGQSKNSWLRTRLQEIEAR